MEPRSLPRLVERDGDHRALAGIEVAPVEFSILMKLTMSSFGGTAAPAGARVLLARIP
jgi:hypothetical protein